MGPSCAPPLRKKQLTERKVGSDSLLVDWLYAKKLDDIT
jgi:hypothetical protein